MNYTYNSPMTTEQLAARPPKYGHEFNTYQRSIIRVMLEDGFHVQMNDRGAFVRIVSMDEHVTPRRAAMLKMANEIVFGAS